MAILKLLHSHPYEMADAILCQDYMQHVPEEEHIYSRTYQWLKGVCIQWRVMVERNWEIFHQSFPMHAIAAEFQQGNNDRAAQLAILYEATRMMYLGDTEGALRDFDDAVERGVISDPTLTDGWSRGLVAANLFLTNGPPGTLPSVVQRVEDDLEDERGNIFILDEAWIDFQRFEVIRERGLWTATGIPWRGEFLLSQEAILRNEVNHQFRLILTRERKEWKDRRDARINTILQEQGAEDFAGRTYTRGELRRRPTLIPDFYDGNWNHHRFRDQDDPRNQQDDGWGRQRELPHELAVALVIRARDDDSDHET